MIVSEPAHRLFESLAEELVEQRRMWIPLDRTVTMDQSHIVHHAQHAVLADISLRAGGAILNLAVQDRLESLPRFRTRALQIRAELRRAVQCGEFPHTRDNGTGFDSLVRQLFDDCRKMWLPDKRFSYWRYGGEADLAAIYIRFLREFAEHVRTHPPAVM